MCAEKKYIVWWFPLFFSEFQILVSNRYVDYEDAFFEGARIGKCWEWESAAAWSTICTNVFFSRTALSKPSREFRAENHCYFFWWLLFAAKHHVSIGNWNYNRGKLNTDRMKQYFSRCFLATLFGFLECKISLSVARNADALQPFTGLCAWLCTCGFIMSLFIVTLMIFSQFHGVPDHFFSRQDPAIDSVNWFQDPSAVKNPIKRRSTKITASYCNINPFRADGSERVV